jgi:hypothetical protein
MTAFHERRAKHTNVDMGLHPLHVATGILEVKKRWRDSDPVGWKTFLEMDILSIKGPCKFKRQ